MSEISKYFHGERTECLIAILIGLTSIALACFFLIQLKRPLYTGMAYPFMVMALIEIIVCASAFVVNPERMEKALYLAQTNVPEIHSYELPRMEAVMRSFVIFRWVEITLFIAGMALLITIPSATFWKGVGIGLVIQTIQLLVLDYFDERRATIYIKFLKQL